jgi:hypothetical protein
MIKLNEILQDILAEKKLCKKGKAYYNRRRAAGEKPSAYLSGRAVKVCKGLMEEDDLNEAKQVGTLYHYTMLDRLKNIIISNTLEASTPEDTGSTHKDYSGPAISFTRTKYKPQSIVTNESDAALVIDGNKLSNNYKSIPFQDSEIPDDEMEERIYNKNITNLNKYIIKVILYESDPEIESLLKEKNIPYELNLNESLRDWFKKEDWVRIDTAGNITGPCGTMKKGNKTTRCLPRAKANSLTKAERAATSRKKAASNKQFVPNTKKAKVKFNK